MSQAAAESAVADAPPTPAADTDELVRTPRQDRSRRTLRRIVEAGFALLESEGPEALTVTGIMRRARTSVGSFYARFQGKDDLLRYLGERALEESLSRWDEAKAELPVGGARDETVAALVRALGALYLEGPAGRLLLLEGVEDPEPSRTRRLSAHLAGDFQGILELGPVRAEVVSRVAGGMLREAPLFRGGAGLLLPELVELLVGYLERPTTSPDEAAAVWTAADADAPDARDALNPEDADAAAPQDASAPSAAPDQPDAAPPKPPAEPPAQAPSEPDAEPDPFDVWV